MIDLVISLTTHLLSIIVGIALGRSIARRRRPAPRASFDTELTIYLQRENRSIITSEELARLTLGIHESPHVPRDQITFVHPDTLSKLTRDAGPELIKAFQEWGDRHRYTSPFLKTCSHEWPMQVSPPGARVEASWTHEGVHKCSLGVMTHGPKCVCQCGATAAYVEQPDGSIDKTFEEPVEKTDLSERLASWRGEQHAEGCRARWTPTSFCSCGVDNS